MKKPQILWGFFGAAEQTLLKLFYWIIDLRQWLFLWYCILAASIV
jgi:hypothetical protein